MKRWLAYILIVLFSIQTLPVKELGKFVQKKSQTTQSVCEDEDGHSAKESEGKMKSEEAKFLAVASTPGNVLRVLNTRMAVLLHDHALKPQAYHFEVPTPPPNYIG